MLSQMFTSYFFRADFSISVFVEHWKRLPQLFLWIIVLHLSWHHFCELVKVDRSISHKNNSKYKEQIFYWTAK